VPARSDLQLKAERVENRQHPVQTNRRLAALEFYEEAQADPSRSRKLGLCQAHALTGGADGLADCLKWRMHGFPDREICYKQLATSNIIYRSGHFALVTSCQGTYFLIGAF